MLGISYMLVHLEVLVVELALVVLVVLVIFRWGFLEYFVMVIGVYQNELGEFENFCFVEDV